MGAGGTDSGFMGAEGRGGWTMAADGTVPDSGGHCVPPEAMFDQSCASAVLGGSEFIFDVETHWFSLEDLANFPAYTQAFGPLFAVATEDAYISDLFC